MAVTVSDQQSPFPLLHGARRKTKTVVGDSLITSIPWFPQDPVPVKKSRVTSATTMMRGKKLRKQRVSEEALHIWAKLLDISLKSVHMSFVARLVATDTSESSYTA